MTGIVTLGKVVSAIEMIRLGYGGSKASLVIVFIRVRLGNRGIINGDSGDRNSGTREGSVSHRDDRTWLFGL